MRIAYVSAGAAGMICGSCLHDNTLAAAIRKQGHEIVLIPTYTPMRTDERDVSRPGVFYGAVNLYLQHHSALFRHTPRLVDRLLDHPALLGWASRKGAATSAADLGDLTRSVLEGEEGNQRKELLRLVAWVRDEFRPDIVHLTNSMFLGLAAPLKRALGVPIVCSVQGEDLFLEALPEPDKSQVLALLRRKARDADAFIATGGEYAGRMSRLLDLPPAKVSSVALGISLEGHREPLRAKKAGPFVVGYLARICPEKGFHLLAEAFAALAAAAGPERVRLRAAGYLGPKDRAYFEEVTGRLAAQGLAKVFDYAGEVDRAGKIEFLRSLDVLSVPTVYQEAKGLFVLEALANGVPVVQPRHGSFPEMLEATGGGVLVAPGSAAELAAALDALRQDPERRRALGERGRVAVLGRYSDETMAQETVKVYLAALGGS
ncbi:MAG TPA: glycosyltransferase family 4 protein, partial [Candidatus Polarisedimenticolia bacterium]|nr:glycosyltransferase family 4 protein [Candidatus Polarisedimenticolia bacterium]